MRPNLTNTKLIRPLSQAWLRCALKLRAVMGFGSPAENLPPYGPWQELEPRANNYKDRVPGMVHLGDAKKLEADRV